MQDSSKFQELLQLLHEAERMASQYSGGYSGEFLSAEEFHAALKESIIRLKDGDMDQIDNLWTWFAPTTQWDDFIGMEGMELANKIFDLLKYLKKQK